MQFVMQQFLLLPRFLSNPDFPGAEKLHSARVPDEFLKAPRVELPPLKEGSDPSAVACLLGSKTTVASNE